MTKNQDNDLSDAVIALTELVNNLSLAGVELPAIGAALLAKASNIFLAVHGPAGAREMLECAKPKSPR